MYAAEQDFMMLDPTSGLPLGFINSLDTPAPAQKPFFCGTGAHRSAFAALPGLLLHHGNPHRTLAFHATGLSAFVDVVMITTMV